MAKYALCIGINDYPGTSSDLSGCVNDVRDWKAALVPKGFNVSTLTDRKATGNGIRAGIKNFIGIAVAGDTVVIQYSGHGSFTPDLDGDEPDGTDECICPYDVVAKGPITDDELHELYSAKAPGVRLIIISDSCHSGSVSRYQPMSTPAASKSGSHAVRRRVRFLPPETFLKKRELAKLGTRRRARASSPPGHHAGLLMSGCQDVETSADAWFEGRANGAFSFVALRALRRLKANATYQQWFAAIRRDLPSQQYAQSPNLYGSREMKRWKAFA